MIDAIVATFENKTSFIDVASFLSSSDDNISQGVSLNGNPVQLDLTFDVEHIVRVQAFMEMGYNMHVCKGEVTFHEVDVYMQSY